MSTTAEQVSRWSRRFTVASLAFLLAWSLATLADVPRRAEIALGLFGFVFHMVFGRGYALIPTYFDRSLELTWLPVIQFPLTVTGTVCVAAGATVGTTTHSTVASTLEVVGAALWFGGILAFVGGMVWTVRTNPTGTETGTGEHNSNRRPVDRLANLCMPAAFAYLLAGSYEVLASETVLPLVLDGYPPQSTHLLAVGAATLLVFAVGFRLYPRLLRGSPPLALVVPVLALGTISPLGLAVALPVGDWFPLFAATEAAAIAGYAVAVALLVGRADSPRVGTYGLVLGAIAGLAGVGLGLWFAVSGPSVDLVTAHIRLNVLGFLGLTIIGTTYQFYPPAVSQYPGGDDRTAALSLAAIAAGLAVEAAGYALGGLAAVTAGKLVSLVGVVLYVVILLGAFASQ